MAGMAAGGLPPQRVDQVTRPGPERIIAPGGAAGILRARFVIISGPGGALFVYSGTPSRANLVFSITGVATTDPIGGNPVPAGAASYTSSGGNSLVVNLLSTVNAAFFQYNAPSGGVQGSLILSVAAVAGTDPVDAKPYGAGLTGTNPVFGDLLVAIGSQLTFSSPSLTRSASSRLNEGSGAVRPSFQFDAPEQTANPHLQMWLEGTSPDGTNPAQALFGAVLGNALLTPLTKLLMEVQGALAITTGGVLVNATAFGTTADLEIHSLLGIHQRNPPGTPAANFGFAYVNNVDNFLHYKDQTGKDGTLPATEGDSTAITVTAAAATRITKSWNIPASNGQVSAVYRLKAWGFGTEGSTAQNITWSVALNGAVLQSVTATALTVSAAFRWAVEILLHVVTTGAGGTADVALSGIWSTTASPATSNDFVAGSTAAGGEALNTTVANTLALFVAWASVTGAPTITCDGSTFERIGP
jgi:hypothetical protein